MTLTAYTPFPECPTFDGMTENEIIDAIIIYQILIARWLAGYLS